MNLCSGIKGLCFANQEKPSIISMLTPILSCYNFAEMTWFSAPVWPWFHPVCSSPTRLPVPCTHPWQCWISRLQFASLGWELPLFLLGSGATFMGGISKRRKFLGTMVFLIFFRKSELQGRSTDNKLALLLYLTNSSSKPCPLLRFFSPELPVTTPFLRSQCFF